MKNATKKAGLYICIDGVFIPVTGGCQQVAALNKMRAAGVTEAIELYSNGKDYLAPNGGSFWKRYA